MSKVTSATPAPVPDAHTKHNITLTKEQYFSLLKTVYLGNWVANANRGEIDNKIAKYCKELGMSSPFGEL